MRLAAKYSQAELGLIRSLCEDRLSNETIAQRCNMEFHSGRPVRTAGGIGFASEIKLRLSSQRFAKTCEVCGASFRTSWPQARYCGEGCRQVIEREYATKAYRLDPAKNVNAQTIRVRTRIEKRWKIILRHFGNMCQKCGCTFPRIVYDLHHPNGKESRKSTPSKVIRSGTDKAIDKMLSETILLCANCHRLTHGESGNWAPRRKDT